MASQIRSLFPSTPEDWWLQYGQTTHCVSERLAGVFPLAKIVDSYAHEEEWTLEKVQKVYQHLSAQFLCFLFDRYQLNYFDLPRVTASFVDEEYAPCLRDETPTPSLGCMEYLIMRSNLQDEEQDRGAAISFLYEKEKNKISRLMTICQLPFSECEEEADPGTHYFEVCFTTYDAARLQTCSPETQHIIYSLAGLVEECSQQWEQVLGQSTGFRMLPSKL